MVAAGFVKLDGDERETFFLAMTLNEMRELVSLIGGSGGRFAAALWRAINTKFPTLTYDEQRRKNEPNWRGWTEYWYHPPAAEPAVWNVEQGRWEIRDYEAGR